MNKILRVENITWNTIIQIFFNCFAKMLQPPITKLTFKLFPVVFFIYFEFRERPIVKVPIVLNSLIGCSNVNI